MFRNKFPWGRVTAAFVIGVAAGAVTALLLTPKTGREMQKQIKEQAETLEKAVRKMVA